MLLLGLGLKILIAAATVGAVAAIIVYISGTITRSIAREKAQENGIKEAIITEVDNCSNVVKIRDLDSDQEVEIHGDCVDWDLNEGDKIYA